MRTLRVIFMAIALATTSCTPSSGTSASLSGPAWQELLQTAAVDQRGAHWPSASELSLEEAQRALEVCVEQPQDDCVAPIFAAQPQLRGAGLQRAWSLQLQKGGPQFLRLFLERGAAADAAALQSALSRTDANMLRLATVERLLDAGAPIDASDDRGYTALHVAAADGDSTLVALLLKRGADRTRTTAAGNTALDFALASRARDTASGDAAALLQQAGP